MFYASHARIAFKMSVTAGEKSPGFLAFDFGFAFTAPDGLPAAPALSLDGALPISLLVLVLYCDSDYDFYDSDCDLLLTMRCLLASKK